MSVEYKESAKTASSAPVMEPCNVRHLKVDGKTYRYYDVADAIGKKYARLPYSLKVVLESMVRRADKEADGDIAGVWRNSARKVLDFTSHEGEDVLFQPSRVLLQDFTGVPALVDLAAIRDVLVNSAQVDPKKVDSLCPADLVVDHSVQLDYSQIAARATAASSRNNLEQRRRRPEVEVQQPPQTPPTIIVHSTFPPPQPHQQWQYTAPAVSTAPQPVYAYYHPVAPYQMPIQTTTMQMPPAQSLPTQSQPPPAQSEVPIDNPGLPIQDEVCPFHHRLSYWAEMLGKNQEVEFARNSERFSFLKWVDEAFDNITVIPPGTGVMHQVNLEFLARVVTCQDDDLLFPDSLVGTDTHTTMINGVGVLGWAVGTLDAESIMFGHPIQVQVPRVIGVKITGTIPLYATSTEIVLLITKKLRHNGVANCFVEFFGPGVAELSIADRATIANMCPEYGALVGFFPCDELTMKYLAQTGRESQQIKCIREYLKAVGMFRTDLEGEEHIEFSSVLEVNLSEVQPCISGPKRTKDKVGVDGVPGDFQRALLTKEGSKGFGLMPEEIHQTLSVNIDGSLHTIRHGSVLLAAITSCSNTSNPSVMLGAGLLARKAIEAGLSVAKYVKTSLSPGSGVVTSYLHESGVMPYLYMLGFEVVGYGCSTCVNNSRPLPVPIVDAIRQGKLVCCGVLSGNRNFEGRIQSDIKANYLASPMLVIAYSIAGRINIDFNLEPLGFDKDDQPVFLRDVWPSREEIQEVERRFVIPAVFRQVYSRISYGNKQWSQMQVPKGCQYPWNAKSTFIQPPAYVEELFSTLNHRPRDGLVKLRCLLKLGDNVTSDHISPAGSIVRNSPAADYLAALGLVPREYNSYGARRGNCEVMVRGTFAHPRLKNLLGAKAGPFTTHFPSEVPTTVYEASRTYKRDGVPLIVIAGENLGRGTARDWATKGLTLLGVRAVLAVSFDPSYRSNLVRAGILPVQIDKTTYEILTGRESIDILLPDEDEDEDDDDDVTILLNDDFDLKAKMRLDNAYERRLFKDGGMIRQTMKRLIGEQRAAVESN
jgi:aconitate hydratase